MFASSSSPVVQSSAEQSPASSAAAFYELATDLLRHGQAKMAVDYCRLAIQSQPTAQGYKLLGDGLQQLGQLAEAETVYQQALQLQPNWAELYANLGTLYARQKKWLKALDCYQKALSLKPQMAEISRHVEHVWAGIRAAGIDPNVFYAAFTATPEQIGALNHLNLGHLLLEQNQSERAAICYRHALSLDPELSAAKQKLEQIARGVTKALPIPQSISAPQSVPASQAALTNVQPIQAAQSIYAQGNVYTQRQQWENAAEAYRQTIELDSDFAMARWRLAQVLECLGEREEAIEQYFGALSLQPELAKPMELCKFGELLLQQEKFEQALSCYEWALQQDKQLAEAYFGMGEIHSRQEQHERAAINYRNAVTLQPEARAWHGLGDALMKMQQLLPAIAAYRQAIELNPEFSWSHNNLGDALMKVEQWKEAAVAYEQAIKLNSEFHWSYYNLGEALAKLEQWDGAIVAYRYALNANSSFAIAHRKLGDTLQKEGKASTETVLAHYKKALELDSDDLESYHKILEIDPKNVEIYTELSDALKRHERSEESDLFSKISQQITRKLIPPISTNQFDVRLIAFYLPQFHPIPENDLWWGKGFTEWRNVAKAIPQFEGHYQPHLPADLGFYDLRLSEVQEAQAALAIQYGIHGFCYYYYWFNGKRLLEYPLDQMLRSGKPEFPFCICWANENWTRRWDGMESEVLMAQDYSPDNNKAFAESMIPYLKDKRYIRVSGKPLLLIYRIGQVPNSVEAIRVWRDVFRQYGVGEVHISGVLGFGLKDVTQTGCDSGVEFPPNSLSIRELVPQNLEDREFLGKAYDYKYAALESLRQEVSDSVFPGVMPAWDNTARRQEKGTVWLNSSPERYELWLRAAIEKVAYRNNQDEKIVFINAWNEWAEGAHLEPDQKHGHAYLEATRRALLRQQTWENYYELLENFPFRNACQLETLLHDLVQTLKSRKSDTNHFYALAEKRLIYVESIEDFSDDNCRNDSIEVLYHLEGTETGFRLEEDCKLIVSGWFLSKPSPGVAIEVVAENVLIKQIPIDIGRQDVLGVYTEFKCEISGFYEIICLPISIISPGLNGLVLQAVLRDGSVYPFAKLNIMSQKSNLLDRLEIMCETTQASSQNLLEFKRWLKSNRPYLFILHDIASAGAQLFLVRLLEWMAQHQSTIPLEVLINISQERIGEFGRQGEFVLQRLHNCATVHFIDSTTGFPENLEAIRSGYYSLVYVNTCILGNLLDSIGEIPSPIIVHVHELNFWIKHRLGIENFKLLLKYNPYFIACANAVKENLLDLFEISSEQIEVIHEFIPSNQLAIQISNSRSNIRSELNLTDETFVLVSCGTLDWRKGGDLLVPLIVQLKEKLGTENFKYVWIGSWVNSEAEVEMQFMLEKSGLDQHVLLTGYKTNPIDYMNTGDVFLLTSREDPFPIVMLEAGLCKLPVVGFNKAGGVTEFVELDAGFTVPYLDLSTMAEKCACLYRDPALRQQMGENAFRKVKDLYNEDILAPKIMATMLRLAQHI